MSVFARSTPFRALLWLALAALTLPLLFEATSGCGFSSPSASAPIDDNAYTCACNCDDGPRTVSIAVGASSDDAEQTGATMSLNGLDPVRRNGRQSDHDRLEQMRQVTAAKGEKPNAS